MTANSTKFFSLILFAGTFIVCGSGDSPVALENGRQTSLAHKPFISVSTEGPLLSSGSDVQGERTERSIPSTNSLQRWIDIEESNFGSALTKGNRVTLLVNGPATYAARFKAIQNARDHINLEVFSIENNEIGRKFADLLIKKQSEGVQVNLMYDSVGSFRAPASFFERLRKGGVQVLEFNPVNPFKARGAWRPAHRDHRKVLIVDGSIAITGGINFTQDYSTGLLPSREELKMARMSWRDTDVQIEGPAVAEFQKDFLETWKRQRGPALSEREYFPPLKKQGDDLVLVLASFRGRMRDVMYTTYLSVINSAEKSIHLTNAFFLPDERLQRAFIDAAARGVDVKIILPAFSDNPLVFYAERFYRAQLLKSGIKFYERRKEILHAKTGIVDGAWSTVGSTNIDYWSFYYNNEENAVILSGRFAAEMEEMFKADLGESREITLEEWVKRPLSDKIKEWCAHLFARWL
jgi:cardiolipin synthase